MEEKIQIESLFRDRFSQERLLNSELLEEENDFSGSPYFSMQGDIDQLLITETARLRGLDLNYLTKSIYTVSGAGKSILFCQNSAETSEVYRFCAQLKHITKEVLSRNGIPVPPGEVFEDYEEALRYFEQQDGPVVVKPIRGSHGRGITTGVDNKDALHKAWEIARDKSDTILIEQHLEGSDVRVNVLGGRAVSACLRIPANVVGDGEHTIQELIDLKNQNRRKNPAHLLMSEYIQRTELLEKSGRALDSVPHSGERVWLSGVANVSVGGEGIQLIEHLNPAILDIAERAAKAFPGVCHVGVDVLVPDYDTADACKPYIIEINTNSATSAPVFPNFGEAIDLPQLLFDYLFEEFQPQENHRARTSVDTPVSTPLAIAPRWDHDRFDRSLKHHLSGQKTLISLAAYRRNLKSSEISSSVFAIESEGRETLFHRAMPDVVLQGARRACIHDGLRTKLLEQHHVASSLGTASAVTERIEQESATYRLLVIDGRVVSGLRKESGRNKKGKKSKSLREGIFRDNLTDVSESIHEEFAHIATKAVRSLFNPVLAGVDIIAQDISQPPSHQPWLISDVVCNPALGWHYFPTTGFGRDVAPMLLDSLFPGSRDGTAQTLHLKISVTGAVDREDFEHWVRERAIEKGVDGRLEKSGKESAHIFVQGTPVALSALLSQYALGPDASDTFEIQVKSLPCEYYEGFTLPTR